MRKKFLDNLQKRKEEKIPKMSTHPQRFCLRWNNHQSNLLTTFDQLFLDETFTDVTLAIDGRFIKAHKVQFLFLFLIFIIRNELSLVELFTICEHFFCSFFLEKVVLCTSYHIFVLLKKCLIVIPSYWVFKGKNFTETLNRYHLCSHSFSDHQTGHGYHISFFNSV